MTTIIIFSIAGLLVHLILKLLNATRKPGFTIDKFIDKNYRQYLGSLITSILLTIALFYSYEWYNGVFAVFVGYSGSSGFKNIYKRLKKIK